MSHRDAVAEGDQNNDDAQQHVGELDLGVKRQDRGNQQRAEAPVLAMIPQQLKAQDGDHEHMQRVAVGETEDQEETEIKGPAARREPPPQHDNRRRRHDRQHQLSGDQAPELHAGKGVAHDEP